MLERWVAKSGKRVAKLVAHLIATAALWVRIQTSPKKIKGATRKGVANKLKPAKKLTRNENVS
jgi:hypothetical protein